MTDLTIKSFSVSIAVNHKTFDNGKSPINRSIFDTRGGRDSCAYQNRSGGAGLPYGRPEGPKTSESLEDQQMAFSVVNYVRPNLEDWF